MKADLSKALTNDLGKNDFANWTFEINGCIRDAEHTISHLYEWMKDVKVDTPFMVGPGRSSIMAEPLGVCAIIGSWNYPFVTTLMPLIAAIAAGNCVVLKPSESSTHCSKQIRFLFARNLDSNCYKVVEGGINCGKKMTSTKFD
jgi:aldehyde dehydrogenase (NAD+)